MKKLFFLLLTVSFCFSAFSKEPARSWVETKDGKVDCKKVVVQSETAKMTLENGETMKIPANQILSYSRKGKVFLKRSYYKNGKLNSPVFMRLVESKENMDLLRYYDEHGKREFVFKGTQLYQIVNDTNRREFYKYFGIWKS